MCGGDRLHRAAAAVLPDINLLLAVYSGAALTLSARLKWDPSLYIPLRELLPVEYSVVVVALPILALVLLLLGHMANAALRHSRGLLYLYAALMVALVVVEVASVMFAYLRVRAWLRSPAAAAVAEMHRELTDHLQPLLRAFARIYQLPTKLTDLIAEAKADLPRNGHAAAAVAVLLLLLQLAGATTALLVASRGPHESSHAFNTHTTVNSPYGGRGRGRGRGRDASADKRSSYAYEKVAPPPPVPGSSRRSPS